MCYYIEGIAKLIDIIIVNNLVKSVGVSKHKLNIAYYMILFEDFYQTEYNFDFSNRIGMLI